MSEAFVYGDSLRDHLIGIYVVEEGPFTEYAKKHGVEGNFEDILANEKILEQAF